jgi:transcriptional regulator with XRE-family HTH domain
MHPCSLFSLALRTVKPQPAILAYRRKIFTLDQLGGLLGLSRTTVWRIEQGNPRVRMSAYVAYFRALGVTLEQRVRRWDDADKDLTREDPVDPLSRL